MAIGGGGGIAMSEGILNSYEIKGRDIRVLSSLSLYIYQKTQFRNGKRLQTASAGFVNGC